MINNTYSSKELNIKYKKLKIFKNKKNFLKNIWLSYIINYHLAYLNVMKNYYFLIIYNVFLRKLKKTYVSKKVKKIVNKKKRKNNFLSYDLTKIEKYNPDMSTDFLKKFKIFNYYYLFYNRNTKIFNQTIFSLYPRVRNFYVSIKNKFFHKIWSIGMFLNRLRLKYKTNSQKHFLKHFFLKIERKITKNITVNILNYSKRNLIFLNQLRWKVRLLNRHLYRYNYLKFKKLIISVGFKVTKKKNKKKPNKKKSMRKKHRWYVY